LFSCKHYSSDIASSFLSLLCKFKVKVGAASNHFNKTNIKHSRNVLIYVTKIFKKCRPNTVTASYLWYAFPSRGTSPRNFRTKSLASPKALVRQRRLRHRRHTYVAAAYPNSFRRLAAKGKQAYRSFIKGINARCRSGKSVGETRVFHQCVRKLPSRGAIRSKHGDSSCSRYRDTEVGRTWEQNFPSRETADGVIRCLRYFYGT